MKPPLFRNPHGWIISRVLLRPALLGWTLVLSPIVAHPTPEETSPEAQAIELRGDAGGRQFDGIGAVNGGGATSVLLKDYPEPQRSQILDLLFKPKFGASTSAVLVEIPGDANSTQGSMPSHMHERGDLSASRGYTWWILQEAKKRNPAITLDALAWSAPGWIGKGQFWSQDMCDYYVKWIEELKKAYGLDLDAVGCRNEKGVNLDFPKKLRATLNEAGFQKVKIHGFDNFSKTKFDWASEMLTDAALRDSVDIISAHTFLAMPAPPEVRALADRLGKPIWNSEEHVYKKGFDCEISIVQAMNENFIISGATKVMFWYDVAGVYPMEPYSEDPSMLLARSPWSGHYEIREALWAYAHYGQFSQTGWQYLNGGCGNLKGGGTFVTLKSPENDYSVIVETKGAPSPQRVRFTVGGGLSSKELCVWRSNEKEQFVQQEKIVPDQGSFTLILEPDSVYSLSTTTGQQKGSFPDIPPDKPFPFPYYETFEEYGSPEQWGYLPRYTADISGAFEIAERPDHQGKCLHQSVPIQPLSWAPEWLPYTILGDDRWSDYEISADISLGQGESGGVMGRVNHVGTGYGTIPKGYFLQLASDGQCRLVVVRGKAPKKPVGDVEQQALLKAQGKQEGEWGEKVLATASLPNIAPGQWHNVKLRFSGSAITGLVDGAPVLSAMDTLYPRGMAGLIAGGGKTFSGAYFDNLLIHAPDAPLPSPTPANAGTAPLYKSQDKP
ncbi:galactosylceramidase [Verrucomicrobium sp. GAS474]|uniref:galactosylceramidase n=1 Tax=Verrucomicrobium sp. GAS474 TaxID=1882831 RepID=UPI00087C2131|nr:galactosylceramidase [Verrucomicrobium sp. GAS474]SDU27775.1 galactosylceramidase [Verrucomicrobium sp. GAS474]